MVQSDPAESRVVDVSGDVVPRMFEPEGAASRDSGTWRQLATSKGCREIAHPNYQGSLEGGMKVERRDNGAEAGGFQRLARTFDRQRRHDGRRKGAGTGMPARWSAATLLIGFLVLGVGAPALASPPENDDFASADVVSSLPFADSGDLAATTAEFGEPSSACLPSPAQTAWYVFSPSSSGIVRVGLAGSDFTVSVVAYRSSGGGFGGLSLVGCGGGFNTTPLTFAATAGSTYYLQVGQFVPGPGHLELRIEAVTPPPNDDFVDAEPLSGTPVSATADLTAATIEPGEPAPGGSPIVTSAWYAYTPVSGGTVVVQSDPDPSSVVAVYTGSSLGGLTEVASGGFFPPVHFAAQAGTTYYVQVAKRTFPPAVSSLVTLTVDQPGPPTASFVHFPFDPSIHDTVQFSDLSRDPAFIGFAPNQWDFGDGTTATGCCLTHRYSADGDYTVSLTVTTLDGRTASAVQVVSVRTHDVSIERLQAPNSAREGQSKDVRVQLRSEQYPETVRVALLKSVAGGPEQAVGAQTLQVLPAHGGRSTRFNLTYTFTADDAATGKVTFRAVATIEGARDALPADNQAIAAPTEVKR